jgi:hypothetical protein
MIGIRKLGRGVVGVLDDGTVLVCDKQIEEKLRAEGVKVIRVGKVNAL